MKERQRIQGIEDFATLMSCLDYRIDDFKIARPNKHTYVDRLRARIKRGEYAVVHLSYLRPLGIEVAAGIISNKELNNILARDEIDTVFLEKLGIPMAHLLWNIALIDNNEILLSWYAPTTLNMKEVREWIESKGGIWLGKGWKLPIHTCLPRPSEEDIPELSKRFNELLAQPLLRLRAPIIAYILVALLDRYPLAPLREIASLPRIAAARDIDEWLMEIGVTEKLRWRFILRYYKNLSQHYVVGRYRLVYPSQIRRGLPLIISGPRDRAKELYGLFSLFRAAHMFMFEKKVFATLRLPPEEAARLVALTHRFDGNVHNYRRAFLFPLPFEYYDPLENRWREKRVDKIPEVLRKLRYIIGNR